MTTVATIPVKAVVDGHEQAAVRLACARLESSLSAASGALVVVPCTFEPTLDALETTQACVVIASLLAEVANHGEPWPAVERRLRQAYQRLAAREDVVIFICTVLRHVSASEQAAQGESKRVRIRRLNLLAAEISRETGIYVIDLDRNLADMGAGPLQTDYRLSGGHACQAAAKFIALAVISAGLDAFVPFEVQDRAKATVSELQIDLPSRQVAAPDIKPSNVLALGTGRRKQVVQTVVDTNTESHTGWLLQLMLSRQFGIADAVTKLKDSIARRGWRASLVMILAALQQLWRGRARMGR
jgi:protein-tyrosine-phosphatase